jgi:ankyrin repeat protein
MAAWLSYKGHEQIVRLLVEKGADANAQGGYYGNALQAASSEGHEQVVRLLVEKGADVNAQDGEYGCCLGCEDMKRRRGCIEKH